MESFAVVAQHEPLIRLPCTLTSRPLTRSCAAWTACPPALCATVCQGKLIRGTYQGTEFWSQDSGLGHARREGMKAFRIDASMELGKF